MKKKAWQREEEFRWTVLLFDLRLICPEQEKHSLHLLAYRSIHSPDRNWTSGSLLRQCYCLCEIRAWGWSFQNKRKRTSSRIPINPLTRQKLNLRVISTSETGLLSVQMAGEYTVPIPGPHSNQSRPARIVARFSPWEQYVLMGEGFPLENSLHERRFFSCEQTTRKSDERRCSPWAQTARKSDERRCSPWEQTARKPDERFSPWEQSVRKSGWEKIFPMRTECS